MLNKYLFGCTDKIPFSSQNEARSYMRGVRNKINFRVYRCPHCLFFHITSENKTKYKYKTHAR